MAENLSWLLPIITLSVSLSSAIIALFTYRRVSTKHLSKTPDFSNEVKANEKIRLLNIVGSGTFQRLEISADGSRRAKIILVLDNETCLIESLASLSEKKSKYLTQDYSTFVGNTTRFSVEVNLEKNFFKSLELFIDNKDEDIPISVNGRVHFTLEKKPF